jgi:DNA-binding protein H-NS
VRLQLPSCRIAGSNPERESTEHGLVPPFLRYTNAMNASVKELGERSAKRVEKTAVPQAPEPGRLPEIAALTDDELLALVAGAQTELTARRERRRAEFFETIREQARTLGIDPNDVAAAFARNVKRAGNDRRSSVAPKYRNPENAAETWSGRGAQPKWLKELVARGRALDEFLISA